MISNTEKKILEFLHKHILVVALVVATILSALIRYELRTFVSGDARVCLLPWHDSIKANGQLRGLGIPIAGCNYNFPYLLLTALMSYLPLEPLNAYKVLSCIFDYLMAFGVAKVVSELSNHNRNLEVFSFIAVILSPIVFLNSAAWAQCDSIYTCFLVWALYFLIKEKFVWTFLFYGLALAFKLQFIFALPFLLFYYFYKKVVSIAYFALIPIPLVMLSLPALIQGRTIHEMIALYTGNTNFYTKIALNYPSFWQILNDESVMNSYDSLKRVCMLFTVALLGIFVVGFCLMKVELSGRNLLYAAFWFTFTTVLFLPAMHERYGFVYEVLAIALAFLLPKTAPLAMTLIALSMYTYGHFLYESPVNLVTASIVNVTVYVIYGIILWREVRKDIE